MVKQFKYLIGCTVLLAGCGQPVETLIVKPPKFDLTYKSDAIFSFNITPVSSRYIVKDGKSKQKVDDVTVEVSDVITSDDNDEYTVAITNPSNEIITYKYSLYPMVIRLKITNNSDHIMTLTKTIVKLEDDQQRDYPMISSLQQNKDNFISKIEHSFAAYYKDWEDSVSRNIISSSNIAEYQTEYEKFKSTILNTEYVTVSDFDFSPNTHLTENGKNIKVNYYSPNVTLKRLSQEWKQSSYHKSIDDKFVKYKNAAIDKIKQIPEMKNLFISSGIYQPINILPHRTEVINIPFSPRKASDRIKFINVAVFDLPTQVDNAGNPTKRANFYYELIAAD